MSYAQRKEISGNRTLAIIIVVVLQFALGYAIVTGLAYNVIKKAAEDLKTFDVEEQPPPPEEPPPPPKDMPKVPPPPMTPPPLVRMEAPPPPIQTVECAAVRRSIPPVAPAPPAPPPPPRKVAVGAERQGRPADAVQRRRLSGVGAGGRRRGHGPGVADDRPRRPRGRLQHHPVDRQQRARFGDLQHSSPPREVHAGARQQRQRDDATRSRRRRSSGVWKANYTRF